MLKTLLATILLSTTAACSGAPGVTMPAEPEADSGSPAEEAAAPDAPEVDSGAPEATTPDSGSPDVAVPLYPDAMPAPVTADFGNVCVVYLDNNPMAEQFQVTVAPPSCPAQYSVSFSPACSVPGDCFGTSCDAGSFTSVGSATVLSTSQCSLHTSCTVSAPDGLNAIPVGSMLSGTCAYVADPNQGA